MREISVLDAATLRLRARKGLYTQPTAGQAPGALQTNLVAVPQRYAFDFLLFVQRNAKALPLVEVLEAGRYESQLAPGSDVRTDVPRYWVYRNGMRVEEVLDAREVWREDLVTFLIGCSFTFEAAMMRAGLPVRHIEEGRNVPMYRTHRPASPAGVFSGPLVVTMRPVPLPLVSQTVTLTARYPLAHGAPIHIGAPEELGIRDLNRPDYGEAVTVRNGEVPVFWACGVTAQAALEASGIELAITHAPGHMFVTDVSEESANLAVF